jgi:hypothetical protein
MMGTHTRLSAQGDFAEALQRVWVPDRFRVKSSPNTPR